MLVFGLGPVTGLWLYGAGGQAAPFLVAPLLGAAGAVAIALSLRGAPGSGASHPSKEPARLP